MRMKIEGELRGREKDNGFCFNPAVWSLGGRGLRVLPRWVGKPAGDDQPDAGELIMMDLDASGRVVKERRVWEKENQGIESLEDGRAAVVGEGLVVIGMTAVVRCEGVLKPFPAMVTLENWGDGIVCLPRVRVLTELGPGKNTTPLNYPDMPGLMAFRSESKDQLQVFWVDGRRKAEVVGNIKLTGGESWASHRAGFAAPPQGWEGNRVSLGLHGMNCENNFYTYALGMGSLTAGVGRGYFEMQMSRYPICDSQSFPGCPQLHPKIRKAIYCVGQCNRGDDEQVWAISVGDTTIKLAVFNTNDLKRQI